MANLEDIVAVLDKIYTRLDQQGQGQGGGTNPGKSMKGTPTPDKSKKEESNLANVLASAFNRIPILGQIAGHLTTLNRNLLASVAWQNRSKGGLFDGGVLNTKFTTGVSQWMNSFKKHAASFAKRPDPYQTFGIDKLTGNLDFYVYEKSVKMSNKGWKPDDYAAWYDKTSLYRNAATTKLPFAEWRKTLNPLANLTNDSTTKEKFVALGKQLWTGFRIFRGRENDNAAKFGPEGVASLFSARSLLPQTLGFAGKMSASLLMQGLAKFATGVTAAAAGLTAMGAGISAVNRGLAGFSPLMATSFAIADIRDTFRDMASAQRRAPAQAAWNQAYGNLKDKWQPIMDNILNIFLGLATLAAKVITPILGTVGTTGVGAAMGLMIGSRFGPWGALIGTVIGGASGWIADNGGWAGIMKKRDQWITEHADDFPPWMGPAHTSDGKPVKSKWRKTDHWNWRTGWYEEVPPEQPPLHFPAKIGPHGENLWDGSVAHVNEAGNSFLNGVKFKGFTDIKKSIDDAIVSIKELNKVLNDKGGDKNMTGVPVAAFMAGVATSNFNPKKDRNFEAQRRIWDAYHKLGWRDK